MTGSRSRSPRDDRPRPESLLDVYNIEDHGKHVFRVTADGVLVHHEGPVNCGTGLIPRGATRLSLWGDDRLPALFIWRGIKPSDSFSTSLGPRFIDRLVDRIAHESMAGIDVALNGRMCKQMLKDKEFPESGQIKDIHWHF